MVTLGYKTITGNSNARQTSKMFNFFHMTRNHFQNCQFQITEDSKKYKKKYFLFTFIKKINLLTSI